ncbi:hypothetical protein L596_015224 [Steinernema carpocapsae]|uniref:Uncharacterized protein n=1 Tax=Steinernema carpocapsae TaxID=34508 RepID=A0A4U5NFM9_STECR|nr:hypothetical protein L596_015224 [Steinernema carpocapsae]
MKTCQRPTKGLIPVYKGQSSFSCVSNLSVPPSSFLISTQAYYMLSSKVNFVIKCSQEFLATSEAFRESTRTLPAGGRLPPHAKTDVSRRVITNSKVHLRLDEISLQHY